MAEPLNVFKTVTQDVTDVNEIVYTVPSGKTAIILMAQIANITETPAAIDFLHFDAFTADQTELLKGFVIPGNDATSPITGKLVIEEGNSLRAVGNVNDAMVLTISLLESLNA
jgi:hypothetical protein